MHLGMSRLKTVVMLLSFPLSWQANALDLSAVSGLYQSEKYKNDGTDGGGQTTISVGGQIEDIYDKNMTWLARGMLILNSYSAPENGKAPDDDTSLEVTGGGRYYLTGLGEEIKPFMEVGATFRNRKTVQNYDFGNQSFTILEESGLYYHSSVGLKFLFSRGYFFEFGASLFESALFATETQRNHANGEETSKSERSRTDLFIDMESALATVMIGLGKTL